MFVMSEASPMTKTMIKRMDPMITFRQMLLRIGAIVAAVVGLAAHYAWGDVLTNHDGRFTVNFPGKATETTQTINIEKDVAVAHIYTY